MLHTCNMYTWKCLCCVLRKINSPCFWVHPWPHQFVLCHCCQLQILAPKKRIPKSMTLRKCWKPRYSPEWGAEVTLKNETLLSHFMMPQWLTVCIIWDPRHSFSHLCSGSNASIVVWSCPDHPRPTPWSWCSCIQLSQHWSLCTKHYPFSYHRRQCIIKT